MQLGLYINKYRIHCLILWKTPSHNIIVWPNERFIWSIDIEETDPEVW